MLRKNYKCCLTPSTVVRYSIGIVSFIDVDVDVVQVHIPQVYILV